MSVADRLQFFASLNGASQQNLSQNATTAPPTTAAEGSQPVLNTNNLQPRALHSGSSSPTRQDLGTARSNPQLSKAGSRSLGNLAGGGSYSLLNSTTSRTGSHNYLAGGARVNSHSQSSLLQPDHQQDGDALASGKFLSVKERIARYGSNNKELDATTEIKPRHAAAAITVTPPSILDNPHDDDADRRDSVSGPAESSYHRRHSHNTRATPYGVQPASGRSSRHASHQDLHGKLAQGQGERMEVDEVGSVRRASAMDVDVQEQQPLLRQEEGKEDGHQQHQEEEMQVDEPAVQIPQDEEEAKPLLQDPQAPPQIESQAQPHAEEVKQAHQPIAQPIPQQREPAVAQAATPAIVATEAIKHTAAPPPTSAAARPTSGTASPTPKFASATPKCTTCAKPVYLMEQLVVDNNTFHKTCLKCNHCKATLKMGNLASMNGEYYCKPHFKQLFKLKGNYDEGFGKELHKKQWLAGGDKAGGAKEGEKQEGGQQ
ncbi:uncharacterized protein EV422DRAFT_509029 [Fimicolochytrium jonesii]|uniref:uncharacterized protein n=1 Tax=Fimicolochytrium jonesii TaxID=1396493 RepID=UPI0022FE0CB7|nr:uncharacterized protein EV422DRAFT_509029 [Fimicolochytrium jonesii]KAI8817453.1 hypothetical protein EV422DRAFT_509029 [Fimicolochytrium jonesii]